MHFTVFLDGFPMTLSFILALENSFSLMMQSDSRRTHLAQIGDWLPLKIKQQHNGRMMIPDTKDAN